MATSRKIEQGALVAAAIAFITAMSFIFGIKESVAVQGKDIDGIKSKYETVVTLILSRLDRIEKKIDDLGDRQ